MALVADWQQLEGRLPEDWFDARLILRLESPAEIRRAAALLGPLQPVETGSDTLVFRIARGGAGRGFEGQSPEAVRRALLRLDAERIHGILDIVSHHERVAEPVRDSTPRLPGSWDEALATIPADWSDLLGEIEFSSSDYIEPGALHLAPLNPRRVGTTMRLQFRAAHRVGYGAPPGMVRRCFERCDDDGIRGTVVVLRVLSDTNPVGTQGPVWQLDGRTV